MDALIFDFDGVIVDSEPVHFRGFQEVLGLIGVELTEQEYYRDYLGYDDHDCFKAVLVERDMGCDEQQIKAMTEAKTKFVQQAFARSIRPLEGAVRLAREAAEAGIPVGVCSGALKREIVLAARSVGVLDAFSQIVSAEDVRKGKPDPEGYRLALARLSASAGRKLRADRTVVIEDTPAGIEAAKAAGMKALAITNSYPADALRNADKVIASLEAVTVDSLERLL